MLSRVLAFRPATVLERLHPRSDACPLSLRDVLAAAGLRPLPIVEVGTPDLIRAVLVAAKVLRSTLGLAIPRGLAPEAWFDEVVRTADEIAAALPLFLSAEVVLDGESSVAVERGAHEAWRLVEAGLTHVAVEASAVAPEQRGRVLAEVAAPLQERGLCFECSMGLAEAAGGRRAIALTADLARRGVPADVVGIRCPAAPDAESARAQLGALDRLASALGGVPVVRRGPVSPALLAAVNGSRLRGCDDGGAVSRASGEPVDEEPAGEEAAERRTRWREQAAAVLGAAGAERLEARAFVVAAELIEALGAEGSALAVTRALERRLAEDRA